MMNGGIRPPGGDSSDTGGRALACAPFRKMLTIMSLMITSSMAYKHFKDDNYRRVVYEVADFLKREMLAPTGYYSAIDADSEGEGRFTPFQTEVEDFLGEQPRPFP